MERATFSNMAASTSSDWSIISEGFLHFAAKLPDRVLGHCGLLDGDYGGFAVDRLQHSLQTATLAQRAGKRPRSTSLCALLHDIGDTLGSFNHADIAAAVLRPFVSDENLGMVEKHAIFQGYYFFHHLGLDRNLREQFRGHPSFERTALFCERYAARPSTRISRRYPSTLSSRCCAACSRCRVDRSTPPRRRAMPRD
jgi:predicted HD phosphohydrolase